MYSDRFGLHDFMEKGEKYNDQIERIFLSTTHVCTRCQREVNPPAKSQPIKTKTQCARRNIAYHPNIRDASAVQNVPYASDFVNLNLRELPRTLCFDRSDSFASAATRFAFARPCS